MEILIPGLLLVAFMVWLSTRIKRNAAAAFEPETVETGDLIVNKPEGFLHVLNDERGFLFRAYSKEFGSIGRQDVRQATLEVERHRSARIDDVVAEMKAKSEVFEPETAYKDCGERAVTARSTRIRDGGEYEVVQKFVTRGDDVIEARGEVLAENKDAHWHALEEAIGSLRVK